MVAKEVALTLLSFSGLLFGYLLASIAKEEVKPGRKYIKRLKDALSVLLGFAFLYFSWSNVTILATFAIGMVISLIIKKEYFYLGLLVSLSLFLNNNAMLFFSSLVFVYGCLYGILAEGHKWKAFYVNIGLFLLPFLLIWIEYLVGRYAQLVIVACAVALSKYLVIRRSFKMVK